MALYKNTTPSEKRYYGVTFKPGETHNVPGYIHAKGMQRVASMPKSTSSTNSTAKSEQKTSSDKKTSVDKKESDDDKNESKTTISKEEKSNG